MMHELFSAPVIWMIAGCLFIALEAFVLPGVGVLFAGLGAVSTGVLIAVGAIGGTELVMQCAVFFAATTLWALLLWKPLKHFRIGKNAPYNNMIGSRAVVITAPLAHGMIGEVRWSGTVMNARLSDQASPNLNIPIGGAVEIIGVTGNLLEVNRFYPLNTLEKIC
jgi:membrane protein implicated in regulation of membrane protease activity